MKTIYIGADHRGFELKEKIKKWFTKKKIPFKDLGDLKLKPADDYPDYAAKVAKKIKGIRAVAPFNPRESVMSRKDEDANIICLSGIFSTLMKAKKMIGLFLNTPFSGEARHVRRINKIKKLER